MTRESFSSDAFIGVDVPGSGHDLPQQVKNPIFKISPIREKTIPPHFFIWSRLYLETTTKPKKFWKKVGAKIVLAQSVIFRILTLGPP